MGEGARQGDGGAAGLPGSRTQGGSQDTGGKGEWIRHEERVDSGGKLLTRTLIVTASPPCAEVPAVSFVW